MATNIPFDRLNPYTLQRIVERFIARETTSCGHEDYSMESKVAQVMAQLRNGKANIIYDQETETLDIIAYKN